MSRLIRLYPVPWRDRYGAEFEALLEERPPSVTDRIDIVRGAADAWLRPQVRPAGGEASGDGVRLLPSVLALAGGLLFVAAAISLIRQGSPLPYRDGSIAQLAGWLGATLIALGPIRSVALSPGAGRTGTGALVAALVFATFIAGPWPILAVGVYGFALTTLLVGLWRVSADGPSWLIVVAGALLLALVNTEDDRAWLLAAFGLGWIAMGMLWLTVRWRGPIPRGPTEAPSR